MYAFESAGSRKPLHAMVIGAVAVGLFLFSLANREGMPAPFLLQTVAFGCMTAAVYLMVRYSLKQYRYAVETNQIIDAFGAEQYDLVITEITGKKMKVVARVALRDMDRPAVTVIRRADGQAAKDARALLCKEKRVFRFENVPVSPVSCYIPLPEENSVMVIPADETMVRILQGR